MWRLPRPRIDLNATPVAGGSSSGGARKHAREMPADMLPGARNLFDGMPAADEDETAGRFMESIIFEGGTAAAGGAAGAGYNPEETQSQDGRGAFTPSTIDQDQVAFMHDQVGLDWDGFPLDHEFRRTTSKRKRTMLTLKGSL